MLLLTLQSIVAGCTHRISFCVGDRIQVHDTQTRHHGRIARILGIGDRCISVSFEDDLSGKYVEYTDAVLISE
jgi:hypothetical protein